MKIQKKLKASQKASRSLKKLAASVDIPKAVPKPNGVGRPLLYSPQMCEALIEAGDKGLTKVQFCAKIGISRVTFYNWLDAYPDFKHANGIYEVKFEAFYTALVKNKMMGIKQNITDKSGKVIGTMNLDLGGLIWFGKNTCNWKDRQEIEATVGTKIVEVSKEENLLIE